MARKEASIGPKQLGPDGKALWRHFAAEFEIQSTEPLLLLLCSTHDRLFQVRAAIARDGLVLADGKKNPLLTTETQLMAEFTKIWKTLGLADLPAEERRAPGRPPESERGAGPMRIRR